MTATVTLYVRMTPELMGKLDAFVAHRLANGRRCTKASATTTLMERALSLPDEDPRQLKLPIGKPARKRARKVARRVRKVARRVRK